jgi:hypothetical protein
MTLSSGPEAGFTLTEALVALVLLLAITGSAFGIVNPATSIASAQPEAMDMQQRARVAAEGLVGDLVMAGAGTYAGPRTGALLPFFAPVIPRRTGLEGPDPWDVVRDDVVAIAYVAGTARQTTLSEPMPDPSAEVRVEAMPNCPAGKKLCGFAEGMTVLIFDEAGHWDFFTVTEVDDEAGHLQPRQSMLSHAYQPGAVITQAESHVYYHDAVQRQLRHYDGYETDLSVVDNVVDLRFEYFGDPQPPQRPKPPAGVANCLYDAAGALASGLSVLTAGGASLVELPLSIFDDGPWCGGGNNRFDADLLRVRKVRVSVRVQAAPATLRASGTDYLVAGISRSAHRSLPDYTVRFDVSPRNMNLAR